MQQRCDSDTRIQLGVLGNFKINGELVMFDNPSHII